MKFGKKEKKMTLDIDNVWKEEVAELTKAKKTSLLEVAGNLVKNGFHGGSEPGDFFAAWTLMLGSVFLVFYLAGPPGIILPLIFSSLFYVSCAALVYREYRAKNKDYRSSLQKMTTGIIEPSEKSQHVARFLQRKVDVCAQLMSVGSFSALSREISRLKGEAERQCTFWREAVEKSPSNDPSLEDRQRHHSMAQLCLKRTQAVYSVLEEKRALVDQCIERLSADLEKTKQAVAEYFMAQSLGCLRESIGAIEDKVATIDCKQFQDFLSGVGTVDAVVHSLMEIGTFGLTEGAPLDPDRLEKLGEKVHGSLDTYEKEIQAILLPAS